MIWFLILIAIFATLEIKFSPRVEIAYTTDSQIWYLFYTIKSKTEGNITRDYIKILEIKNE